MKNEELEKIALLMLENKEVKLSQKSNSYTSIALVYANKNILKHSELSTLLALSHFARNKKYCYPTREVLSNLTGFNKRYVSEAIKGLETKKIIFVKRFKESNNQERNLYFFIDPSMQKTNTEVCKEPTNRYAKDQQTGHTADVTESIEDKEYNIKNSSKQHTTIAKAERSEAPDEGALHSITLYKKIFPDVNIQKHDIDYMKSIEDQEKLCSYIPYLQYFNLPTWKNSSKNPYFLKQVWVQLEHFIQTFTTSHHFDIFCKDLNSKGIDTESIIEDAETPSKGKQYLIDKYLSI